MQAKKNKGYVKKVVEEPKNGDGPSRKVIEGRVILAVDTTLAPPPVMRGLEFGADVVLISLTKYYCGHNMHLGGALVSQQKELWEHIKFKQNVMGSIISPSTAYSILQNCKTMGLRVMKQSSNALKIAQWLDDHPKVDWVRYPGLESHPHFKIAQKQHLNEIDGGMIAFEVKGGKEAGRKVMNACSSPWTLAENLGAVESIITCPSIFTHANMTEEDRKKAGITDGTIRLSVGIESVEDLIEALSKAIDAV